MALGVDEDMKELEAELAKERRNGGIPQGSEKEVELL